MKERFTSSGMKEEHVCYPLKVVGECDTEKTGTKVTFLPDDTIFEDTVYDYDTLKQTTAGNGISDKESEDRSDG